MGQHTRRADNDGMTTDLDALLADPARPLSLRELVFPGKLQILVAAPHPDDFDAIGVSLRHLHALGHVLHLAVLTTGASGVEDGFEGANDAAAKAALREAEQRASCAFFGLPAQGLEFLRLWDGGADDLQPLREWMAARPADLLIMPHGNDSNRTHRRTFESVCALAREQGLQAWALLNRDAKTLEMRDDLYCGFSEDEAGWKAQLLRLHRSQHQRNLRTRGIGFDERVLQVNRQAAQALHLEEPYAEVFQLLRLPA
jgi:LmbE family N-acetylglucosaminyl deacetylase